MPNGLRTVSVLQVLVLNSDTTFVSFLYSTGGVGVKFYLYYVFSVLQIKFKYVTKIMSSGVNHLKLCNHLTRNGCIYDDPACVWTTPAVLKDKLIVERFPTADYGGVGDAFIYICTGASLFSNSITKNK